MVLLKIYVSSSIQLMFFTLPCLFAGAGLVHSIPFQLHKFFSD